MTISDEGYFHPPPFNSLNFPLLPFQLHSLLLLTSFSLLLSFFSSPATASTFSFSFFIILCPSLFFLAEISFDLLVRRQIARLEQPGLECVKLAYDEMERMVSTCVYIHVHVFVSVCISMFVCKCV